MVETVHPVQLIFTNVASSYTLSATDRASIIEFAEEVLKENLDKSFELIEIVYAGGGNSQSLSPLPLSITVKAPADVSDFVLAYIMGALENNVQDILSQCKSLNWNAFKDVSISTGAEVTVGIEETDRRPTPRPTPKPSSKMVETIHPVQLIFKNASNGYRLSAADRTSIIRFIKGLMNDNLDASLELIQVGYTGKTDGPSLPLRITVKGPANESDIALSYVMEVLEDHDQDIEIFVKSLDRDEFKDVSISVETDDPTSITTEPEAEVVEMEVTEHPVQLTFQNVPTGYRLSAGNRASIIRYVKDLVDDNIDESFELIEVAYAGSDRNRNLISPMPHHTRRLDALSLPLRVTVKGPANESDFALSYVMDVLEDHEQDIARKLKSLDWDAFKNVGLSTGTYDSNDITESVSEIKEMETTVHPVQLTLENVPAGYRLSVEDRASVLRFVKELIEDNIDDQFQLIKVAYAGSENNPSIDGKTRGDDNPSTNSNPSSLASLHKNNGRSLLTSRRLDSISLPLQITVKGSSDFSDFALSYVMEVLKDNMQDLVRKFKSLDWDTFKNVLISTSSYDPDSISEPSLEMVDMEETEHPVQLIFKNVAAGYRLSAEDRASLIRFVKELLEDNLDESMELIEVAYAGTQSLRSLQHTRRLDTLSLPLQITVKGPANRSDFALSYLMDVLEDNKQDLVKYLKSLDSNAFKDVKISSQSYDLPSITTGPEAEMVVMTESEHPVQLTFNDIVAGYRLSAGDQASIIRFIKELLEDNIDESLELVQVAYAGRDGNRSLLSHNRRLEVLSLPLRITVRGPADESDFALSYLMEVLEDHKQDIVRKLKSIDGEAFMNSTVSVSSDSAGPGSKATEVMDNGEENTPWWFTSWWVWLSVAIVLLLLLCCLCICCGCMCRYKQKGEVNENKPMVVEKPLIIEKPALYPPMQHPNILVPYQPNYNTNTMVPYHSNHNTLVPYQSNHNTMVHYQPRVNPATVQNNTTLVPYTPRQVEVQRSKRRDIVPTDPEDSSEESSWESETATSGFPRGRLEPPEETNLRQKPLQIRAAPAQRPRKKLVAAVEPANLRQNPLQIRAAPAQRPRKKLVAAVEPNNVRSAHRTGIDPPERANLRLVSADRSYKALPPTEQEQLQICDDPRQEPLQICDDPNPYYDSWDEESTQPPTQEFVEVLEQRRIPFWGEEEPYDNTRDIV